LKEGRTEGRKETGLLNGVQRPRQWGIRRVVEVEATLLGIFQYKQKQPVRTFQYQKNQLVRIFQKKIFGQYGYSSTIFSVSKNIQVQNIQPLGIFQYKKIYSH
jgi:hypothetical protein